MRNWKICCIVALLTLHGCATSDGLKTTAISERNIDNLARLNLGMSEEQVLGIMRDPHAGDSFQLSEDQYDVWFYVVHPTVLGQTRMVPFNLTPLVFRNKILVGM
jgi:outer membrane protein assembly factor BamE (lipoprotein component of BamABCDE complex)